MPSGNEEEKKANDQPVPAPASHKTTPNPQRVIEAIKGIKGIDAETYIPDVLLRRLLREYSSPNRFSYNMLEFLCMLVRFAQGDVKQVHEDIRQEYCMRFMNTTLLRFSADELNAASASLLPGRRRSVVSAEREAEGELWKDVMQERHEEEEEPEESEEEEGKEEEGEKEEGEEEEGEEEEGEEEEGEEEEGEEEESKGSTSDSDAESDADSDADSDAESDADDDDDDEDDDDGANHNTIFVQSGPSKPNPCLPPRQLELTPVPPNGPTSVHRVNNRGYPAESHFDDNSDNGLSVSAQERSSSAPDQALGDGFHEPHRGQINGQPFHGAYVRYGRQYTPYMPEIPAESTGFATENATEHVDEVTTELQSTGDATGTLPLQQGTDESEALPTPPASSPSPTEESIFNDLSEVEAQNDDVLTIERTTLAIDGSVQDADITAPAVESPRLRSDPASDQLPPESTASPEIQGSTVESAHVAVADDADVIPNPEPRKHPRLDDSSDSSPNKSRRQSSA